MKALVIFVIAFIVSGCANTAFDIRDNGLNYVVVPIKYTRAERIRAGNVLFVNRSPVWRDVLVYDGHKNERELFGLDDYGNLELLVLPIGRFKVGPAELYTPDEDTDMNRMLVRFIYSNQEYTLVIVNKNIFGEIIPPLFTIFYGRVADPYLHERYYRRAWLGTKAGHYVWDIVNDVEYLPYVHISRHYRIDKDLDIDFLLARAVHRLRGMRGK